MDNSRKPQLILDGIDIFTEVVDAQSFSRAARRLGMPTSTVSAKIARLEARLGTTLLRRTTRQLSVTPMGQSYYDRCVRALAEIAEAERELADQSQEPAGPLKISAAADLVQFKLAPLIETFLARYPRVSVDLVVSNQQVDLVADGIDLVIRPGTLPDSTLVARRYCDVKLGLWASQDYLDQHGIPQTATDLAAHQIVRMARAGDLLTLYDAAGQGVDVSGKTRLSCDDMLSCHAFVQSGAGIGIVPEFIGHFPRAPLVRVLPDLSSPSIPLFFVYPAQRFVPQTLRAFIDLAAADDTR